VRLALIAYGNMVHNPHAIDAILSDGTKRASLPRTDGASRRRRALRRPAIGARAQRDRAQRPEVLRRVGGHNIDVCCPQSERPYTVDGSVNYAHLLVGSEALPGRAGSR
jgi:hypothetical protein